MTSNLDNHWLQLHRVVIANAPPPDQVGPSELVLDPATGVMYWSDGTQWVEVGSAP